MARRVIIAGIPNYATSTELVDVTARSAPSTLPASRLQDERPSEMWRSTSAAPSRTIVQMRTAAALTFPLDGNVFGLIDTNLSRDGGLRRVIGFSTQATRGPVEVVPNGEGAEHLVFSGDASDVDEGFAGAADGNRIVFAALTGSEIMHLTFPNPASPLASGTDKQSFVVELLQNGTPTLIQLFCKLYVAGVERVNLGSKILPASASLTSPFTVVWSWDAADLADLDGEDVEIWMTATGATGGLLIERVVWDQELATTYASNQVFDSGWARVYTSPGNLRMPRLRPEEERAAVHAYYVTDELYSNILEVLVLLKDDQVPATLKEDLPPYSGPFYVPSVPDGYTEAGVALWSHGIELVRGAKFGRAVKIVDPSGTSRTLGGQLVAQGLPKRRAVYVDCAGLDEEEAFGLADRVDFLKGATRPVFVIPDPDNEAATQLMTIYGTMVEPGDYARMDAKGTGNLQIYGKSYVFEEYR